MKNTDEATKQILFWTIKSVLQLSAMFAIIMLYFVVYRRTLSLPFIVNIYSERVVSIIALCVFPFLPMILMSIAWVLSHSFSKSHYVNRISLRKKILFSLITLFLSLLITNKINYLEYYIANRDTHTFTGELISADDPNRQTNFFWLKTTLLIYTASSVFFDIYEEFTIS